MNQHVDYTNVEQGSEEWRKARVGVITGSNVGAILGNNPHKSAKAVMKTMVQEAMGHFKNLDHVPAIRWGNMHEATAAGQYAMEECGNLEVQSTGFHTLNGWLGASPDRLVGKSGLLEIKCPFSLRDDPEPVFLLAKDQPYYYDQMQMQMLVTGRSWTDFYQWSPYGTSCERVMYDPDWFDKHEDTLEKFHQQYVEALAKPEEYLDDDQLLPEFDDDEVRQLAQEYAELKPLMDDLKPRFERVEKALKAAIKTSSQGCGICVRVSTAAGNIDYKRIVEERLPDLTKDQLEAYRKPENARKSIRFIE